ncbi:protein kinase [Anaeramoeba flamelloides]|uniref:Protein kinase n=1 Tax=Anaeramoeba flamelloides TaxID=1746091 RepID=A0AAV7ZHU3_9EUKA|nr:protein kinase [Anaeramoeba flamelloides]
MHNTKGRTLGTGSFSKVKLAVHNETGQKVAIKILSKSRLAQQQNLMNKVKREITVQRLIKHPSILQIFEVFETNDFIFLILEYVSGGELFDYIVECGTVPSDEARQFFQQIIYGLEHIHSFSITHRDLKPENLLLDINKNVKIADFGMARVMEVSGLLQTSCGSPHYASPEVLKGKGYDGQKSDIWSCGVILYSLLNGCLPFDESTYPELINVVKSGKFEFVENLPEIEKDLIIRMLTVDPEKRITLKQIKKHSWFTYNFPQGYIPPSPVIDYQKKIGSAINIESIDKEIVDQLGNIEWVDSGKIIKALQSNSLNSIKIIYELFRKRKNKFKKNNNKKIKNRINEKNVKRKRRGSLPVGKTKRSPNRIRRKSINETSQRFKKFSSNIEQSKVLQLHQLVKRTEEENDLDYDDFSEIVNKVSNLDLVFNNNNNWKNSKNNFEKISQKISLSAPINLRKKKTIRNRKIINNQKIPTNNKNIYTGNSPSRIPSILSSKIDITRKLFENDINLKEKDKNNNMFFFEEESNNNSNSSNEDLSIYFNNNTRNKQKTSRSIQIKNNNNINNKNKNSQYRNIDFNNRNRNANTNTNINTNMNIHQNNNYNNNQNYFFKNSFNFNNNPVFQFNLNLNNIIYNNQKNTNNISTSKYFNENNNQIKDYEEEKISKKFNEQKNFNYTNNKQNQIFGSPLFHRRSKIYQQQNNFPNNFNKLNQKQNQTQSQNHNHNQNFNQNQNQNQYFNQNQNFNQNQPLKIKQEKNEEIGKSNIWLNSILNKKQQKKLNQKLKQQLKIAKKGLYKSLEQNQNLPIYICQDRMIAVSSASFLDVILKLQNGLTICNFEWSYPSLSILIGKINKIKIKIKIEKVNFEQIVKILTKNILDNKKNEKPNNKKKKSEKDSLEQIFKTEQLIFEELASWGQQKEIKWNLILHFIWKAGTSKTFIEEVNNVIRFISQ